MKSKLEIEYEVLNIDTLSETEKKLFEEAKNSRLKAYAPYSKFLVGCSILLENGEIYTGRIVPPCGSCRQSIVEYEVKQAQNIEIYIASISGEKIIKINSIKDLLPFSFDTTFL